MNVIEEGVLLLCCRLGDPSKKPLTPIQYRELGMRFLGSLYGGNHLTQLTTEDLHRLNYSQAEADRILDLLDRREQFERYLAAARELHITPVTRVSDDYPARITKTHGKLRPPVLFAMGDTALLNKPAIALVGSRKLQPSNRLFAERIGQLAAEEGYVLVSGGAVGADTAAQEACLAAGGSCVVYVPDRLDRYTPKDRVVYVSEHGYEFPFTAHRALHRNTLIHAHGEKAFAAQCTLGSGGTWQGCMENLKHGWSDLYLYDDGSEAVRVLTDHGACAINIPHSVRELQAAQCSLF